MRIFTFITAILTLALLNLNCGDGLGSYEGTIIKGEIDGAANLQVFIDEMTLNNTANVIDKAEIDGNGKFVLKIERPKDVVYRLRIGAKSTLVLASSKDKVIELKGSLKDFQNFGYELTGSPSALEFKDLMTNVMTRKWKEPQVKEFIAKTDNAIAAMFAAMSGMRPDNNLEIYRQVSTRLKADFPKSNYIKDFDNVIAQTQFRISQQKIKVGQPAPDINEADPNGKKIALSSLKGQVVLIDFWASWCRPCRFNNPKLVALYQKYKDEGFTVYSVSLDKKTQKNRWVKAIEDDKLTWPYHVSDLNGWGCLPAKEYGVRSIPQTFLLDKEGNIAALNLHGSALESEVARLLKEG